MSREWSKEWLFVHTVIKYTPQGMYHAPGRTVYHMVAIWKQPDSSWNQIPGKLIEPILALYLYLSLLTWPLSSHIMPNIRWWYSLPVAEAKATTVSVPMGLDATLGHYVSHPIILYPPSHPVLPSPTLSPSPHRLQRSPPPPSKLYPPAPPNTLFKRNHVPSPILLARAFLLTTPVKF